jgi:hypothetical protein
MGFMTWKSISTPPYNLQTLKQNSGATSKIVVGGPNIPIAGRPRHLTKCICSHEAHELQDGHDLGNGKTPELDLWNDIMP